MATSTKDFNGTWKCYKNEKFEDYMKATGANFMVRKAANLTSPQVEIKQDDDHFTVTTTKAGPTSVWDFRIGEEFVTDAAGFGNSKIKHQPSLDNNKLVIYSEFSDNKYKPSLVTREIIEGELVVTLECEGVVGKRWFKKQ